jgi:hypothetical protein
MIYCLEVLADQGEAGGEGWPVVEAAAEHSTIHTVAASLPSVTIAAANPNRKGLIVYNDSEATLFLGYAASTTPDAFTFKLPAKAHWEMEHLFEGTVSAVWSAEVGRAVITEIF